MPRRKPQKLSFKPVVVRPCEESWGEMTGSLRERHCQLCDKKVHNFASMTVLEIERLMRERNGRLCARITERDDGSIETLEPRPLMPHGFVLATQLAISASIALGAVSAPAQSATKSSPNSTAVPPSKAASLPAPQYQGQERQPTPVSEKDLPKPLEQRTFMGEVDVTVDDGIVPIADTMTTTIESDANLVPYEVPQIAVKAHYSLSFILRHPIAFLRSLTHKQ